jgi:ABC-2 type transport system ATP-binding protein
VVSADDTLYELMDVLREAGVTVEEIRTVRPELEEVFVDLTGMEHGVVDTGEQPP